VARDIKNWPDLTEFATDLSDVPISSQRALFYRERNSHRGIFRFQNLQELEARMVNQDFLEEICELENLKYLSIEMVTATDLKPLNRLKNLNILKIGSVRQARDFGNLAQIESLKALYLCNVKYLTNLDFLADCNHLIRVAVEGSMWKNQKVETLAPLRGLTSMEELFLTAVTLRDKDLTYLAECPRLKALECARFAPKKNFEMLRELMPELSCRWCDKYEIDI